MGVPLHPLGYRGLSGETIETSLVRVRRTAYSPGLRWSRHAHELANLCVVLRGDFEEIRGSRSSTLQADQVLVKPGGIEHANVFGAGGAYVLNIDLLDRSVNGWRTRGSRSRACATRRGLSRRSR